MPFQFRFFGTIVTEAGPLADAVKLADVQSDTQEILKSMLQTLVLEVARYYRI